MADPQTLSPMEQRVLALVIQEGRANGARLIELDELITVGTVYSTLKRMKERGLVLSLRERRRGGRAPSYYKATPLGKRVLAQNERGAWHVAAWKKWCTTVGLNPLTAWKAPPGEQYRRMRTFREEPWQMIEAVDAWVQAERAKSRARRAS